MKRSSFFLLILVLMSPMAVRAQEDHGRGKGNGTAQGAAGWSGKPSASPVERAAQVRQPVVINISRPSSGGHNRNFPSQQPASQPQSHQPSYGKLHWQSTYQTQSPAQTRPQQRPRNSYTQPLVQRQGSQSSYSASQRLNTKVYSRPGTKAASVAHHHAYTQGYVRKKLQKIGVTVEPSYITNRSEFIHTDRQHSAIDFPKRGPDRTPLTAAAISPRHFNDEMVRDHMALVSNGDWHTKIQGLNQTERQANRYYWHEDNGFNYCHYIDNNGYHWYGWYAGNQYFWNRYYNGRWWLYDSDYDRWCFWNNGFWWWQDPYHVGELYCYDNSDYIPANSADDPVVVTGPDNSEMQSYGSPDGTRTVKVDKDTQDAFLYDTANPPTFDPVYLASGVKNVQFSDTSSGRPLEIILTLNDGSFDMFDGLGNPYNSASSGVDQGNPDETDSNSTPNGGAPPADNNAPLPDNNTPTDPGATGT